MNMLLLRPLALAIGLAACTSPVWASGSLNIICGVQVEWCNLAQKEFSKISNIKVNMVQKGSGEALAQIAAESANPKTDLWFGGTGDTHLQAAEKDLTVPYQSPNIHLLYDWAIEQAKDAQYRTVGIYSGPLGFAYNTELLAKKKLAAPLCWKDLVLPQYKGEIQMANPNSSGTAYLAIATLVQLTGEDAA